MEKIISILKERKLFSFVLVLYIIFLGLSIFMPFMNVAIKIEQQDGYYGSESGYKPRQGFSLYSLSNPEKIKYNLKLINSELLGKGSCHKIVGYDSLNSRDSTGCNQERINTILKFGALILVCVNLWALFILLGIFFFDDGNKERNLIQNIKIVSFILLGFGSNAIIGQIFPTNSETVWFNMGLFAPLAIMNIIGLITIINLLYTEIQKRFPKKKA